MSTRFTVVVPTRERCDTLEWALKTCVTQDYDNLEILVSDNNSADDTEAVVRSYDDPRIRYINPGRRLSMTDNFEFALSHVTGGFVTCIGDDDGLTPNALTELDRVIRELRTQAITWRRQVYYWPGYVRPFFSNTLHMSLFQDDDVREVDAARMLRDVISFRKPYYDVATFDFYELPSIYYSFVDYDVVRAVMARSGKFFHSVTPDMYSSVAIACVLDRYHIASRAYAIAGASHHSNGASYMSNTYRGDKNSPGNKYLSENTIPFHHDLVMVPASAILLAEAYLQARDHMDEPEKCAVDMRKVIRAAVEDRNHLPDPAHHAAVVAAVEEIAAKHGLEAYAREVIAAYPYRSPLTMAGAALRLILSPNSIFSCDGLGVTNIYDATLAFDRLREKYRSPLTKRAVYLAKCAAKTKPFAGLALSALKASVRKQRREQKAPEVAP
jgi:glycosyltransferase involved in cell wall biosynthesis